MCLLNLASFFDGKGFCSAYSVLTFCLSLLWEKILIRNCAKVDIFSLFLSLRFTSGWLMQIYNPWDHFKAFMLKQTRKKKKKALLSCLCFAYFPDKAINPAWYAEEGLLAQNCARSPPKRLISLGLLLKKCGPSLRFSRGRLAYHSDFGYLIVSKALCWDVCKHPLHIFAFLCCEDRPK